MHEFLVGLRLRCKQWSKVNFELAFSEIQELGDTCCT